MPQTAAGLRRTVVDLTVALAAAGLAWTAAGFEQPDMLLTSLVAVIAVVIAVIAGSALERALPQPCATVLVAVGPWLAIYACVPETSDQMFHVAALLVVLGTTELTLRSRLPWWVHTATVGLVAWAGLYGSSGRSSAVVGAVFALWPFVLLPAAVVLAPSFVRATAWAHWSVVAVATAASLAVARSGALGDNAHDALVDVAWAAGASAAITALIVAVAPRHDRDALRAADSIEP